MSADQNIIMCRNSKRGSPMTVSYEHVRIASKENIFNSLLRDPLEDVLISSEADSAKDHDII